MTFKANGKALTVKRSVCWLARSPPTVGRADRLYRTCPSLEHGTTNPLRKTPSISCSESASDVSTISYYLRVTYAG